MRSLRSVSFIVALATLVIAPLCARADATGWPKTKTVNGFTYSIYEPQVDSWDNYRTIKAHAAVALTKPATTKPVMGVIAVTAQTLTDFDKRAVQISNVQVTSVKFPQLSADENLKLDAYVIANVKLDNTVVPLDTILLNEQRGKNATRETKISTEPPLIFTSQTPALLVVFDGEPIFSPIKGLAADLKFAVNTNWNVFKTGDSYYLLTGAGWLRASSAKGPWKAAGTLPGVFQQLPHEDNWKDARAALNASPASASQMPIVWVTTKPAEAIVIGGEPKLVAISGTKLSYVDNTDATLLFHNSDKRWYYYSSGRWFSATSLNGPWAFANDMLPADFQQIPAESALGWVLPSIPGTAQSKQAILEAQVPREAWVDRGKATLEVAYAGDPKFEPIKGTSLQYATNTDVDVIKAGDDAFYACKDAVWFMAPTALGPWVVTDKIPAEIYQIPSDSSVYQDTYVTVQDSTTSSVLFGYTAGWTMSYYWHSGWYYGPGYWYPPYWGWIGPYPWYYPYPRTYVGGVWYNPATGGYGRGFGVRGPYGGATVAGGYHGASGSYWRAGSVYGPYGGIGRVSIYNPATGNWYHGVAAWGPNGVYYRGQGGNRYGGNPTPYQSWGNAAHRPNVNTPSTLPAVGAKPGTLPANRPGGATGVNKPTTGAIADNVYAGRDGNVYRPSTGGAWDRYNNSASTWQPAATPAVNNRPAGGASAVTQPAGGTTAAQTSTMNRQTYQGLQQSSAARTQGAQNFGGARAGGGGGRRGR